MTSIFYQITCLCWVCAYFNIHDLASTIFELVNISDFISSNFNIHDFASTILISQ